MSGIYIPGMEMPKEGGVELLIYAEGFAVETGRVVKFGDDYAYQPTLGEVPAIRAIPVPDHGDLIDRNVSRVFSWSGHDGESFEDGICFALDWLEEQHVVIPADPAKEGEG